MLGYASRSVTTGGAFALAATFVKIKGMVSMMFFHAVIVDMVMIIFTDTTTAMTVS